MTLCIRKDGAWAALPFGQKVVREDGEQVSYETLEGWAARASECLLRFGVFEVAEPDPPPAGKVEAARELVGDDRPAWKVEYRDAPGPGVPESVFDYQFAGEAEARGFIDRDECDAWVGPGVIPKTLLEKVQRLITDTEAQRRVVLFLKGSKEFPRHHANTVALAALFGLQASDALDAFFVSAKQR